MLAVGKDTNLGCALYKGVVEFWPGAARERDNAHIVVGHDEAMCQHLQGVECRVDLDVSIGELTLECIGKAEEKGAKTMIAPSPRSPEGESLRYSSNTMLSGTVMSIH